MKIEELQPALFEHFKKLAKAQLLSHAYLFVGGFGNEEMAVWLAQAIFCQQENKPCGVCRICRLITQNAFSDLHCVEPDGQSIKIEQVRELLADFSATGFESEKKVVIIKQADKMGVSAANSLLKAIEEPVKETYIFLLTDNDNLILPTIKSRTQKVVFPQNIPYMIDQLEKLGVLKTQAELIAQVSHSVEGAISLAQSNWFKEAYPSLVKFTKEATVSKEASFLSLSNLMMHLEDKTQQEVAFDSLLVLFNAQSQEGESLGTFAFIQKVLAAQTMWRANVRFQSALESVLL